MTPDHRRSDLAEASAHTSEPEVAEPEEAPTGASSDEPSPSSNSSSGPNHSPSPSPTPGRGGDQRADAAAAYAASAAAAATVVAEEQAAAEEQSEQPAVQHGERVEQDLEALTARAERADEYLLLAQRTQADFENYRKRAAREASLAQERGVAKLVKELLPAIDNLDRALKAVSAEDDSQLAQGIRLVHNDLLGALQRVGVEPFSPDGEPFDPQLHEAVAHQPVDGVDAGLVAEVFQQGFRLGDSVLRPARVLVAG